MEKHPVDYAMVRRKAQNERGRKTSSLYILTAAVIWALVIYSLSPLSKPKPAQQMQLCEKATR